MSVDKKPKLGYWKIRGLGQPIRLLLAYSNVEFEDVYYELSPAPEYSRDQWFDVKYKLGLGPFTNLPYYIEGDLKIVESMAIFNYLSRKYDLEGSTEGERIRGETFLYRVADQLSALTGMCYNPDFLKLKPGFMEKLPGHLQSYVEYLGNQKFAAGDKITKADFVVYEFLARLVLFEPSCLDKFQPLKKYVERVENILAIKKYQASDKCIVRPVNNTVAKWF